ncbi:hypothetical protein M413DRAFT_447838 [Hebeloma cylindrosporum]|uniref:Uncharacterized protein n=1 Tax=Hebeloma cylindrosporum TaxID=76867 RepID=A0A0C2XKQ7_HEBCY|nr:hypothetical protein M413DRAFT_447838 [Hebeloma cylindrosporum h7]
MMVIWPQRIIDKYPLQNDAGLKTVITEDSRATVMKPTSYFMLAFWAPLLLLLVNLSSYGGFVLAFLLPGDTIPLGILPEYLKLLKLCKDAGDNAYVGVLYQGGNEVTFNFNTCYPYSIDGKLAEMAVFCKAATCYSNPNPDCSGGAVPPVPVPVVAGLTLINALDWVQFLGQGATCQRNGLS